MKKEEKDKADNKAAGTIIAAVTEDAEKHGHDVRIRDISYALLRVGLEDDFIAYSVVFGTPEGKDLERYNSLASSQWLHDRYLHPAMQREREKAQAEEVEELLSRLKDTDDNKDITFEENKAAIVELIDRVEAALAGGKVEPDKAFKIIADLRVKLNDKFAVAEKSDEQYVIVQPKHNKICPHTRKECWEMTKEYAMKKFNLVEKQ